MNGTPQDWVKTVTELRHQIRPFCTTNPRFDAIDQRLADILDTIEQQKLSLQVFSQDVHQAGEVVNLLVAQPDFASACRIFTASQPNTWFLDPLIVAPALRFNSQDQRFLLLNQAQVYTLGRGEHCSLPVDDSYLFVSSQHCQIAYDRSTALWTIEDTSRNGTFINGTRLTQKTSLQSGDRII
jgi:FHA domain